jgi:hypothetical protein
MIDPDQIARASHRRLKPEQSGDFHMGNLPVIDTRFSRAPASAGWSAYCAAARSLKETASTAQPAIEAKREGCDGSRSV